MLDKNMDINLLVPLLQVVDSAYPTGGFSHSLGLEAFIHHHGFGRAAKDQKTLVHAFLSILENSGSLSLPFVRAAHSIVAGGLKMGSVETGSHSLKDLDQMCEVCTTNHIAKRASTRQGKSLLEVSSFTFNNLTSEFTTAVLDLTHCHFAVVFGALLAALGQNEDVAQASFLYCVVRSVVATAIRLDVLGSMEGQKVQANLQQLIPEVMDRNRSRSVEDACLTFPVMDILQNTQDTLFCKLFYS